MAYGASDSRQKAASRRRLATRLYQYFINDVDAPNEAFINDAAQAYLSSNYSIKAMLQRLLLSEQFLGGANVFRHYSWPAEFTVRSIKENQVEAGVASDLTRRESEVLALMADGLSNKEIAQRLTISDHTAKFHVNGILGKLGAQSRTEAVVLAARRGYLTL